MLRVLVEMTAKVGVKWERNCAREEEDLGRGDGAQSADNDAKSIRTIVPHECPHPHPSSTSSSSASCHYRL